MFIYFFNILKVIFDYNFFIFSLYYFVFGGKEVEFYVKKFLYG